jgi:endonuclease/exonuclease/phosphatase family metal-dependent hydrolase
MARLASTRGAEYRWTMRGFARLDGVGALALVGGLALGCSLEEALGVDEGGPSSEGETTAGGGPGGGPGTEAADDSSSSGAPATDEGSSSSTGPELPPAACGGRSLRVAAFNVEGVDAGSPSFDALAAIIARIDADVVCLEEVVFWETADLFALADQTGYADVIQAQESPAIGGSDTNACMSRLGLSLVGSYSGWDLSSDEDANDVGRDILVVRVDVAEGQAEPCGLGVVALHLKSGQDELDWFRRQVEAERVVQAVARYREEFPDDPMLIMGDFNENLDDPALGNVFTEIPAGLPDSYRVGDDIAFPLTYQPFSTFEGLGFSIAPATQEDSTRDQTWSDLVRLDYIMQAGAQVQAAGVYNACRDDGVDDAPPGHWMALAGDPLACGVSDEASDHFPVLADLVLP